MVMGSFKKYNGLPQVDFVTDVNESKMVDADISVPCFSILHLAHAKACMTPSFQCQATRGQLLNGKVGRAGVDSGSHFQNQ